jgi:hypothetical protein
MSTHDIRPSSLDGIKRLAKILKRKQQLSHARALDEAAKAAGFQNLRHAQNSLPSPTGRAEKYPLYITAYWQTKEGQRGRETLLVHMREPWCELLKARQLARCRELRHFRIDAADHLETASDINGQETARKIVCAAARALTFMEATGLRPATGRIQEFNRRTRGLPGRDHGSIWFYPEAGQFVLSDEPYHDDPEFVSRRVRWARDNALTITTPTWPGLYLPGFSALTLLAFEEFEAQLGVITENLNRLPFPIVAEPWRGESREYEPVFVSPAREASGRIKRARPRPPYRGEIRNRAAAYGNVITGTQWRPAARMPVSAHREAGLLLNSLLNAPGLRARTYQQVDRVRSDLDEWVQREYTAAELSPEEFSELYYRESQSSPLSADAIVEGVIVLVKTHYPDCAPRRSMLRTLASIRKAVSLTN